MITGIFVNGEEPRIRDAISNHMKDIQCSNDVFSDFRQHILSIKKEENIFD